MLFVEIIVAGIFLQKLW